MGFVLRYSIFISSFAMAWFRMCSILRDGLTSNVFHPSWWLVWSSVFFWVRLPLPDKSSGRKTAILCESVSPLPCSLAHKTWVRCILFYSSSPWFLTEGFLASTRLESEAPWLFECIVCIFLFIRAEGFLASTRVWSRKPLGFWVYSIHFFLAEGFLASTHVWSRKPLGFWVYSIHF